MTFQTEIAENNGVWQISLSGRLDSLTAERFEKSLAEPVERTSLRILMDFSAVDYVSSAGLQVVLGAAKRIKKSKGHLVICGLQSSVRNVFQISGFLRMLKVAEDRAAALALLGECNF